MPQQTNEKINNTTTHSVDESERFTLSASAIQLDKDGNLPTRIPLFVTGEWPNSVKGNFSVDVDDLQQMKSNFDSNIGFPTEDASTGLAIDFKHEWLDKAAGWIKGLELVRDQSDSSKAILYADPVEWTDDGAAAIKSGRFKCISPMGSFGKKNGKLSLWSNVNNLKEKMANVLEGAGLTNAPFLRGMAPIRADSTSDWQNGYGNVVYVYDAQQKDKESSMNLDAVRVKERDALSVLELDLLVEHKDELSAVEIEKFGLNKTNESEISDEDKQNLAAIKDGKMKLVDATSETVDKQRLDALEATATQYRTEKVTTLLDKHVKRGAIKQDQTEFWTKQLLAASEAQRKDFEAALEALPNNELLSKEIGTGEDLNAGSTAREQLTVLAQKEVDAAAKDGKELLFADALKMVYRKSPDLQKQDLVEQGVK